MTRNAATYTDMAIPTRPSSGFPAQVASKLGALVMTDSPKWRLSRWAAGIVRHLAHGLVTVACDAFSGR